MGSSAPNQLVEPTIRIDKFHQRQFIRGRARSALRWLAVSALGLPDTALSTDRRFLIVLGHMRAGSSLLTQLLTSAPGVAGYGETFTLYSSPWAFRKLAGRIRLSGLGERRIRLPEPVLVDKALFSRLTPRPELLLDPRVRVVFLIRDGVRAVQSMVHEFDLDAETAEAYYCERVQTLANTASFLEQHDHPRLLIEFENLTSDTPQTLSRLSEFGGFEMPLSDQYTPHRSAGKPGPGDTTERIRSGRVLSDQRQLDADLSDETMARLREAHASAVTELRRACPNSPGSTPPDGSSAD